MCCCLTNVCIIVFNIEAVNNFFKYFLKNIKNKGNYMNFGNFIWWVGKIVDNRDDKKLGRLKVRVYGYYQDDIPDDDLPWATVMSPIQSSSYQKVGISPTGIQVGATVIGFFFDGETAQCPVIMGTLYGIGDVHPLATGEGGHKKPSYADEAPSTKYAAKYPHNHVISGEGGVIIEMDNTPGSERYSLEHPKGTWSEIQPDGTVVNQCAKNSYRVVNQNDNHFVNGNAKIIIKGNVKIEIQGNVDTSISGNMVTRVSGNHTLEVGGNNTLSVGGNNTATIGGNDKTTAARIDLN